MVLSTLINHPERLNRDTLYELRTLVARYPYFQTARILLLDNLYLLHEPDFGPELRRSVLYIADRRVLSRLIEGYKDRIDIEEENASEELPDADRTLSLIDAFLNTLPEEQATLPSSADVAIDYVSQYLADKDTAESTSESPFGQHSLIDTYLNLSSGEPMQPLAPSADEPSAEGPQSNVVPLGTAKKTTGDDIGEESLEESYFTETLAKIYIKQHKYSRALEIIRSLYLKYPEKNIYFADQIRFLEKLIINNNSK